MATQVDVVNLALDHLHITQKISTINDVVEQAKAASRWWDYVRRALLQHPWDFATRRVDLVQDTDAAHASPSWAYAFTLPASFLKAQGWLVYGFRNIPKEWEIPFAVSGINAGATRVIYSDYFPSSLDKFVYTIDASTVADFPDHFVQAMASALAVKMAVPLRVHSDIFKQAVQIWISEWETARAREATDRTEQAVEASWILARS